MCQPRYFLLPCEIFNFMSPRASALCTARHPRGPEITVPLAKWCNYTEMAKERKKKIGLGFYVDSNLEIDGKKEITAECRGEKATHVESEWGESGVCFAGFTRSECLHLPKTVWDDCMWVLFFFPDLGGVKMRNVSEQSWQWEGVVPVCCGAPFAARLLLRYLIMKNKQPWGTLNFHKTITAFLNPSAPSSSNQRRRETDSTTAKKKKKRVTDKQSTNKQKVRRSDGVTVLRLLPRWHHPATTKNLMLLYFKCTIIHNYTHESAAYPFSQTISERSCTACTA